MNPWPRDEQGGDEYKEHHSSDPESQALLPTTEQECNAEPRPRSAFTCSTFASRISWQPCVAFCAGVLTCLLLQVLIGPRHWLGGNTDTTSSTHANVLAPPYVGSTEVHQFPPATPTNVFPSMFPTEVGHAGPTPTGAEPALIATAPSYPIHSGAAHLVSPTFSKSSANKSDFDLFKHWGNLSPWFSVGKSAFGLDSSPEAPDTCRVTGLHLLHRHGARYPTGWGKHFNQLLLNETTLLVIV